jgi:hypothetical protein
MQLAPVTDDGHSLLEEVVLALRTAFEGSQT